MKVMRIKDLTAKMSQGTILKVFKDDPNLSAKDNLIAFINIGFTRKKLNNDEFEIEEIYLETDEFTQAEILNMEIKDIYPGTNPVCYIGAYVYHNKKKRGWFKR